MKIKAENEKNNIIGISSKSSNISIDNDQSKNKKYKIKNIKQEKKNKI